MFVQPELWGLGWFVCLIFISTFRLFFSFSKSIGQLHIRFWNGIGRYVYDKVEDSIKWRDGPCQVLNSIETEELNSLISPDEIGLRGIVVFQSASN